MQGIIPHLWFDKEAKEAAEFYVRVFPSSSITHHQVLTGTPSGDTDLLSFTLNGYAFMAISAGPYFTLNPAISFMVNFDPSTDADARAHLDTLWQELSAGGKILMPLQEYPFSKYYGWVQDRFGVSWQLILTNPEGEPRPFIMPTMLFTQAVDGKCEEATEYYLSVFPESARGALTRYPAGMPGMKDGAVMFTDFRLADQWFVAMDGGPQHDFSFSEAVSLVVQCETQEDITRYSDALSAYPESEQCGWVKDKYGVSWQITPRRMQEMMSAGTPEQIARVTQAFLTMKRFDIAALEAAYAGN